MFTFPQMVFIQTPHLQFRALLGVSSGSQRDAGDRTVLVGMIAVPPTLLQRSVGLPRVDRQPVDVVVQPRCKIIRQTKRMEIPCRNSVRALFDHTKPRLDSLPELSALKPGYAASTKAI